MSAKSWTLTDEECANVIGETIGVVLNERKLFIVRPQTPTMGEIALEAYGHGRACDAVAPQGVDLQTLLSEIGTRICDALNARAARDGGGK